jgi:hypothetical protein
MSIETTRDNLVSTFIANWSEQPIYTENQRLSPDEAGFTLIQLASSNSEQPCLGRDSGATWERDFGDCVISVHVPVNSETDGLAMAERARKVLSQQRFDETITDVGYTVPAGIAPNYERFYVFQVRIPYRTDNLKT